MSKTLAEQIGLTEREYEVCEHLAEGCKTREIAQRLKIGVETVRTHVRNAMRKTGCQTRAQLVALTYSVEPDEGDGYQRISLQFGDTGDEVGFIKVEKPQPWEQLKIRGWALIDEDGSVLAEGGDTVPPGWERA